MTKPIRKIHQLRTMLIKQLEPSFATDMLRVMRCAEKLLKANRLLLVGGSINIHEFRQRQGKVHKAVAERNHALFNGYFGRYQ